MVMVCSDSFNNISVISWQSVLLMEYQEKTTDLSQLTDKRCHIMLYQVHQPRAGLELTTLLYKTSLLIKKVILNKLHFLVKRIAESY